MLATDVVNPSRATVAAPPTVGWPAKGIFDRGVKIRKTLVLREDGQGVATDATVSEDIAGEPTDSAHVSPAAGWSWLGCRGP